MPDANIYDVGDQVVLQGTFKNRAGANTDPTTVVCRLTKPAGTTSTLSTTNPSVGVFEALHVADEEGDHWYRFEGTAGLRAAGEEMFHVRDRRVPAA